MQYSHVKVNLALFIAAWFVKKLAINYLIRKLLISSCQVSGGGEGAFAPNAPS